MFDVDTTHEKYRLSISYINIFLFYTYIYYTIRNRKTIYQSIRIDGKSIGVLFFNKKY